MRALRPLRALLGPYKALKRLIRPVEGAGFRSITSAKVRDFKKLLEDRLVGYLEKINKSEYVEWTIFACPRIALIFRGCNAIYVIIFCNLV